MFLTFYILLRDGLRKKYLKESSAVERNENRKKKIINEKEEKIEMKKGLNKN